MPIRNRIILHLVKRGVPRKLTGFHLLIDGLEMVYNNIGLLQGRLTKELYPDLGKLYGISAEAVERSMRSAVKHSNIKTSTGEFLADVITEIILEDT